MNTLTNIQDVTVETLLHHVARKQQEGCRFVTLTCTDTGDGFTIYYHFDRHYQLSHLRLKIGHHQPVPSISSLYWAATIAENELKDFFHIAVQNLKVDFEGRMLVSETAPKAPLLRKVGIGLDARVRAPATPEAPPAAPEAGGTP